MAESSTITRGYARAWHSGNARIALSPPSFAKPKDYDRKRDAEDQARDRIECTGRAGWFEVQNTEQYAGQSTERSETLCGRLRIFRRNEGSRHTKQKGRSSHERYHESKHLHRKGHYEQVFADIYQARVAGNGECLSPVMSKIGPEKGKNTISVCSAKMCDQDNENHSKDRCPPVARPLRLIVHKDSQLTRVLVAGRPIHRVHPVSGQCTDKPFSTALATGGAR